MNGSHLGFDIDFDLGYPPVCNERRHCMKDEKDWEILILENEEIEFYDPAEKHFKSQNKRNEFLRNLEEDRTSFTYSTIH